MGHVAEVIQVRISTILPQYTNPESREKFLAEPGATNSRTTVGDERNVVVMRKPRDSEISVVRDGVHYNFAHDHDPQTERAHRMQVDRRRTWA